LHHTIVAYGEILWDLLPTGAVLGGAPFNFVYRANTLGDLGLMISRVGRDSRGRETLEIVEHLGIDTDAIQLDGEHPTGTVPVVIDESGNPDFTIIPNVAYDFIEPSPELFALVEHCDCLYFGTLIQRQEVSRATLHELLDVFQSRFTLLDINLRRNCYTRQIIQRSIERADILKLNDTEARILAEIYEPENEGDGGKLPEVVESLLRGSRLETVVVTLGAKGAYTASRGGERIYSPGFAIEPVDTIGSGDAFAAAFIHALLEDRSLAEACRKGNAFGALVAMQEGATKSLDPREIDTFLKRAAPGPLDRQLLDFVV